MIKNIIFDVGNVLVDFRDLSYMEDLGFSEDVIQLFHEKVVQSSLWVELDRGELDPASVIAEMIKLVPGYEKEAALFFERLEEIVVSFPYARPWLQELRERGYQIYLLSNYPKNLFEEHEKDGRFTFIDVIHGKVVSAYEKIIKPDPAIYTCLLERYGLVAEESVFLDDRLENIEAARALGIQGIHFTSYEESRKALEALLLEK